MPVVEPAALQDWIATIFAASGATENEAEVIAAHLVEANLMGHDSHGVVRTLTYINGVKAGNIVPAQPVEVIAQNGAAVVIDGHRNFGQVIAKQAMAMAIERARELAVGAVVCRQTRPHRAGRRLRRAGGGGRHDRHRLRQQPRHRRPRGPVRRGHRSDGDQPVRGGRPR